MENTPPASVSAAGKQWQQPEKLDYAALSTYCPPSFDSAASRASEVEGDVGPRIEALEKQLFGGARKSQAGEAMEALVLTVTVEGPAPIQPARSFSDAALHPVVQENISLCGYINPTAIQGYCIPAILANNDVVAVAQTGSGKTAAYLIPIISQLMGKVDRIGGPRVDVRSPKYNPNIHRVRAEPLVVILCPTRELARQIHDEACRLSYRSKLRPVCAYGGIALRYNAQQLSKGCDILIGTPGRIGDLMDRPDLLTMTRIKYTVIDEADEMLGDKWERDMSKILSGGDTNEDAGHHYLMFSATFPKPARALARQYMQQDYVRLRVGRAGSSHKNVEQSIIWVNEESKDQVIVELLNRFEDGELTIIFCNSVRGVDRLDGHLYNKGFPTEFIHSERTQMERENAMRSFILDTSPTRILVATGVSARGIDVKNVAHVINYDLPKIEHGGIEEYVHRIGRTARIGHRGQAFSFYNERDEELGPALANLLAETAQPIPDFLEQYKPAGATAEFDDDTDDEDNSGAPLAAAGSSSTPAWGSTAKDENDAGGWVSTGEGSNEASGWGSGDAFGGAETTTENSGWN